MGAYRDNFSYFAISSLEVDNEDTITLERILWTSTQSVHLPMYQIFNYTHFSKKRWVLFYYRGEKLGSRVNFLDVLKYPEYENRIFRVSYIYICTNFVIRTSHLVFDRLS